MQNNWQKELRQAHRIRYNSLKNKHYGFLAKISESTHYDTIAGNHIGYWSIFVCDIGLRTVDLSATLYVSGSPVDFDPSTQCYQHFHYDRSPSTNKREQTFYHVAKPLWHASDYCSNKLEYRTGTNANCSADNLPDRVAGLAPVLRAMHVVCVRSRAEAEKRQRTVVVYYSDFRYGHRPRSVL